MCERERDSPCMQTSSSGADSFFSKLLDSSPHSPPLLPRLFSPPPPASLFSIKLVSSSSSAYPFSFSSSSEKPAFHRSTGRYKAVYYSARYPRRLVTAAMVWPTYHPRRLDPEPLRVAISCSYFSRRKDHVISYLRCHRKFCR